MTDTQSQDIRPILRVEHLVKHFVGRNGWLGGRSNPIRAVDDISFSVLPGTTLALVGESGCGKSTTAKLIVQLLDADGGEIWVGGESVGGTNKVALKQLRQNVQMVFQDPYSSLTPHLRIGTLLSEPFLVNGVRQGRELQERISGLLSSVGLDPQVAERFPHELSGGQRQRIGIARALASRPRLVICDEPVSALDVSVRSQIINLLLDLQRSQGLAYLFISHDLDLVSHVSDEVAVMYLGKIVEKAPSASFFAKPLHPYSRALLASSPKPDPRQRSKPAIKGEITTQAELFRGCHFRDRCPWAISVCTEIEPPLMSAADNHLVACHRAEEAL